jgi:putative tryptophan/tyrosine transport system substrate-binding protein
VDRRRFVMTSLAGALAAPLAAGAQQSVGMIPRIGILDAGSPAPYREALWDIFRQALRDKGYVEGRNIAFDFRWASNQVGRLGEFAGELARAKADVIVTAGTPAGLAAKESAAATPVVLVIAGDPVRTGLAASLSRPGGNVTGLTTLSTELSVKRLELLRELLPDFSRLGVLWDNNPAFALAVQDTEQAAWAMNISVHATVVRTLRELETAVITLSRLRVPALEIMPGRIFLDQRQRMADLAARQRLATIYGQREYVDAGGLMSYGSRLEDLFRRAAAYVDRILKGAKPADLPIEQPTKFELVINLKTAKALGLTIPPSLLARADQVIE